MRFVRAIFIAAVFAVPLASAQDAPSFEVASIKPVISDRYDEAHQGVKVDGQIADFGNMSLTALVTYAFHLRSFQVIGPKGMGTSFNIQAKLPDGAKPDQVPDMLARLLVERFQMKFHRENKEFAVYSLIAGPKGAKLTPAPADFTSTVEQFALTMDRYAEAISHHFDKPVINETGLPGKYLLKRGQMPFVTPELRQSLELYKVTGDLAGSVATARANAAMEPPGYSITPILSDLGLKVEARVRPLPVIVIDRIELSATEQ